MLPIALLVGYKACAGLGEVDSRLLRRHSLDNRARIVPMPAVKAIANAPQMSLVHTA